ncbi:hypothetical protein KAR91_39490 [Candidatus Pacearchaeota archaeon]|nr:hypothetical protein [Candidatus Pacearchaeota archaeon]
MKKILIVLVLLTSGLFAQGSFSVFAGNSPGDHSQVGIVYQSPNMVDSDRTVSASPSLYVNTLRNKNFWNTYGVGFGIASENANFLVGGLFYKIPDDPFYVLAELDGMHFGFQTGTYFKVPLRATDNMGLIGITTQTTFLGEEALNTVSVIIGIHLTNKRIE